MIKPARIEIVDSLRGFAVFGILVSHCYFLFFLGEANHDGLINEWTGTFIQLMVNDKFYSLFSFLFGLSFSLMLIRAFDPGGKFYRLFAWRLILLGIIGILHNLHWNDDILSLYAFLGFLLIPVSLLNNKIVMIISILFLMNTPSYLVDTFYPVMTKEAAIVEEAEVTKTYEQFFEAMKNGTYFDTVRSNIDTYKYKLQYYLFSGRFSYMLGFFLLGMVAGRLKLFQSFADYKRYFKQTFIVTALIAAILTILLLVWMQGGNEKFPQFQSWIKYVKQLQSTILTFAFISGMALYFSRPGNSFANKHFGVIGKMALTNYVLHSVIGTLLLCGYGFGLLHYTIPASLATAASIPIFILMILFSHAWMAKFKYGPLEWLWRSAIYLKWMPMGK